MNGAFNLPFPGLLATMFGLGGWELVLILAVILLLFGARKLPDLSRGLRDGLSAFRRELDEEAQDAGKSLGGIYGKPAAEALTPGNQVAELYDPAAFRKGERSDHAPFKKRLRQWLRGIRLFCRSVLKCLVDVPDS